MIKTPLRGRKDPLKFASLPTCGFVAQLVERPTSIREARVQAPSKPEFFFFQASFSAISLIAVYLRGSIRYLSPAGLNMIYFIYYLLHQLYCNLHDLRIEFSAGLERRLLKF